MEQEAELNLPYPPSLNSYYRHVGHMVMISKKGRDYRSRVSTELSLMGIRQFTGDLSIEIDLYPPDKRRRDVDNVLKCLLDSLTDGGLVKDDSQFKRLTITMREPMPETNGMVHISTRSFMK